MSYEKAYNLIKSLAQSQGMYGRILRELNENVEAREGLTQWCDNNPNASDLDLILAIEG